MVWCCCVIPCRFVNNGWQCNRGKVHASAYLFSNAFFVYAHILPLHLRWYVEVEYEVRSKRNWAFKVARQLAEGVRCGYRVQLPAGLDNKLPFAAFRSDR